MTTEETVTLTLTLAQQRRIIYGVFAADQGDTHSADSVIFYIEQLFEEDPRYADVDGADIVSAPLQTEKPSGRPVHDELHIALYLTDNRQLVWWLK